MVSAHFPSHHQIGRSPTLSGGLLPLLVTVALVLGLVYAATVVSGRPWYLCASVVDTIPGRLE